MKHQNWRDLQEWKSEGLPLSTTSNEAAKLYDAAISQVAGWYDEPSVGGLESTLENMIAADPDFVLGRALIAGVKILGTGISTATDPELKSEVDYLKDLVTNKQKSLCNDRELSHVQAILCWSKGELQEAANIWEELLVKYPTDFHALKFAYDTYFFLGASNQIRDCVARVLPFWEAKSSPLPLKGYLHGLAAFGLEETNMYDRAEKEAKKGLELNQFDAWSTHSLAHVYEMQGQTKEGVQFLTSTVQDWSSAKYLACHNYWHLGLYHIERQEFDDAIQLFDNQIKKCVKDSGAMLDIVDATSLLYRLDLASSSSLNLTAQWDEVYNLIEPHLHDQILGFNDAHFMMACLGNKKYVDSGNQLLKNCSSASSNYKNYIETANVTMDILQAMIYYSQEKYESAVECLNRIRASIVNLGGSHAQRDVFHQLLISSAIKSNKKEHHDLALTLLRERKYLKDVSPLTDRYIKMCSSKN